MAQQIDADGVADGNDFDAGAVHDLRDLIIPGDDSDDLLAVALHLLQCWNGDCLIGRLHSVSFR